MLPTNGVLPAEGMVHPAEGLLPTKGVVLPTKALLLPMQGLFLTSFVALFLTGAFFLSQITILGILGPF